MRSSCVARYLWNKSVAGCWGLAISPLECVVSLQHSTFSTVWLIHVPFFWYLPVHEIFIRFWICLQVASQQKFVLVVAWLIWRIIHEKWHEEWMRDIILCWSLKCKILWSIFFRIFPFLYLYGYIIDKLFSMNVTTIPNKITQRLIFNLFHHAIMISLVKTY